MNVVRIAWWIYPRYDEERRIGARGGSEREEQMGGKDGVFSAKGGRFKVSQLSKHEHK